MVICLLCWSKDSTITIAVVLFQSVAFEKGAVLAREGRGGVRQEGWKGGWLDADGWRYVVVLS